MTWLDEEPPLARAGRTLLGRIATRARASWPAWAAIAAVTACLFSLWWWLSHAQRTVTVTLRVTEGAIESKGAELGAGALRAHVNELALTRQRLLDLMRRYPREFPDVDREPDGAVEEIRDRIGIAISENDFVEDRSSSDPPRSARIALTYTASTPEMSLILARELADLVSGETMARERASLQREQTAADTAMQRAQAHAADEEASRAARAGPLPPDLGGAAARERLHALEDLATATRLRVRAADEQKTLRFEMVDPGQLPTPATRSSKVTLLLIALLVALFASALLAGALDPRVLDEQDLRRLGVVTLGRLPILPAAPVAASTEPGGASPRSSDAAPTRV